MLFLELAHGHTHLAEKSGIDSSTAASCLKSEDCSRSSRQSGHGKELAECSAVDGMLSRHQQGLRSTDDSWQISRAGIKGTAKILSRLLDCRHAQVDNASLYSSIELVWSEPCGLFKDLQVDFSWLFVPLSDGNDSPLHPLPGFCICLP